MSAKAQKNKLASQNQVVVSPPAEQIRSPLSPLQASPRQPIATSTVMVKKSKPKVMKKALNTLEEPAQEMIESVAQPVVKKAAKSTKTTVKSPANASPATKTETGTKKPQSKSNHPKYTEMITEALKNLNEKKGSTKQALTKYVITHFPVDPKIVNTHMRLALKSGMTSGIFVKTTDDTLLTGHFKLSEKLRAEAKKVKQKEKRAINKENSEPKKPRLRNL